MESATHLIGALIELTSGVEHSHDDFQCTLVHLLVFVDRDAASVILYCYGIIFVDSYFDVLAEPCHCLVDGVINRLIDKMMQAFLTDVTNIHCRAFANSLKTFEHLNVTG